MRRFEAKDADGATLKIYGPVPLSVQVSFCSDFTRMDLTPAQARRLRDWIDEWLTEQEGVE